jgi:vacuolar-type H+-ATPase subunit F/Vma7
MAAPVFIGDEVTAAGYRLAGAAVRICDPAGAEEELEAAVKSASLILVAGTHAARVRPRRLDALLAAVRPLVLVVADARGRSAMPDVAADVRRELGVQQ